ncbi:MAG: hypothetical protein ACTSUE_10465 [Promethearchaeota archaeon]
MKKMIMLLTLIVVVIIQHAAGTSPLPSNLREDVMKTRFLLEGEMDTFVYHADDGESFCVEVVLQEHSQNEGRSIFLTEVLGGTQTRLKSDSGMKSAILSYTSNNIQDPTDLTFVVSIECGLYAPCGIMGMEYTIIVEDKEAIAKKRRKESRGTYVPDLIVFIWVVCSVFGSLMILFLGIGLIVESKKYPQERLNRHYEEEGRSLLQNEDDNRDFSAPIPFQQQEQEQEQATSSDGSKF